MGIYNIVLDTWAIGERLNVITMIIQSICLFISLILVFIGIWHIYQRKTNEKAESNWKLSLLQFIQLLMMVFSCVFIFFHFWNYIHLYLPTNSMDCQFWFVSLMTAFSVTRILVFAFLMLRSSFLFEGTFCELSSKISIILLVVVMLLNWIPLILQIVDNIPIQPFLPYNSFCWRIQGSMGDYAGYISHGSNGIASLIAVIIFYFKSRSVAKFVNIYLYKEDLAELHSSFKRHIILGICTVTGTIIVTFAGQLLSVTLGISFALDQTVNNILTTIMLKEDAVIYKQRSKCRHDMSRNNKIEIIKVPSQTTKDTKDTTTTNPDSSSLMTSRLPQFHKSMTDKSIGGESGDTFS